MRIGWMFPSHSYNIVLSKDELKQLIEKGHIRIVVAKSEVTAGRGVFNTDKKQMEVHDRKAIFNDLLFRTDERIDDIESGVYPVQFLHIAIQD